MSKYFIKQNKTFSHSFIFVFFYNKKKQKGYLPHRQPQIKPLSKLREMQNYQINIALFTSARDKMNGACP